MTGSPMDGAPWWAKVIYAVVLTPVYVFDVAVGAKDKVVAKLRRKPKNDRGTEKST